VITEAPREALGLATRASEIDSSSADALLALGEARFATGDTRGASVALRAALERQPELAPATITLLARTAGAPDEVEGFLWQQIQKHDGRGTPFELALALHFKADGEVDRAIAQLRRVVERAPRFWEARRELGALLLELDRSEELRADYQEILGALGKPAMAFRCTSCQQKLPAHTFRCPSCEVWDGVVRESSVEREVASLAFH
jgi:lipopolysaccharide biosynthesis regulator YciM